MPIVSVGGPAVVPRTVLDGDPFDASVSDVAEEDPVTDKAGCVRRVTVDNAFARHRDVGVNDRVRVVVRDHRGIRAVTRTGRGSRKLDRDAASNVQRHVRPNPDSHSAAPARASVIP